MTTTGRQGERAEKRGARPGGSAQALPRLRERGGRRGWGDRQGVRGGLHAPAGAVQRRLAVHAQGGLVLLLSVCMMTMMILMVLYISAADRSLNCAPKGPTE